MQGLFRVVSAAVFVGTWALLCLAAPTSKRQNPCFITGDTALPAEVADTVPALAKVITCDTSTEVTTGVPDVISGGIAYSSIDFQQSDLSPLSFALATFTTPTDPAQGNLTALQDQLNDYLAVEAGVRSQSGTTILNTLKVPKFFLQMQVSRVKAAQGQTLSVAETVEHQLGKVVKNAPHATSAELAQVSALAAQA
ncbi:uncharacterized protein STEHIDRAFT_74928 [Stereum hirsutum FP-91666 SS1]|uniref:uncharacterized protein n=1 Tax=Stereum hirsutum (strain FP-91666) TaxID=721885 RepID=UPI000440DD98|nr:uncharacterized protein STEHIDRAFT_74928 [Stereum hirsutum FP-91666 SS1]EIM90266.1 hypothetical protein STEHIDRAFT_74928 [Stereum hirsutum FP-91666 SS1]